MENEYWLTSPYFDNLICVKSTSEYEALKKVIKSDGHIPEDFMYREFNDFCGVKIYALNDIIGDYSVLKPYKKSNF